MEVVISQSPDDLFDTPESESGVSPVLDDRDCPLIESHEWFGPPLFFFPCFPLFLYSLDECFLEGGSGSSGGDGRTGRVLSGDSLVAGREGLAGSWEMFSMLWRTNLCQ